LSKSSTSLTRSDVGAPGSLSVTASAALPLTICAKRNSSSSTSARVPAFSAERSTVSTPRRSVTSSSSVGLENRPATSVVTVSTVAADSFPDSSERSSSARSEPSRDGSVSARRSPGWARSRPATDRISSATVASCAAVAEPVSAASFSTAEL
jgi:hypothetical protein